MKATFKQRLLSLQRSPRALTRWSAGSLLWLAKMRQFVLNPGFRAEVITRWRHRQQHFQGSTFTCENRYPPLFTYARQQLADRPDVQILSFGCSTGEEVFTLANYLPAAHITGVDINPWCLRQCRAKNTNPQLTFHHTRSAEFSAQHGFDAIFCLAVFQRTENISDQAVSRDGFSFRHFAEAIAQLDAKLKPGGLFFIDHTDFSFADTPTAANYRIVVFAGNICTRERPLFGPDDAIKAPSSTLPRVFRKQMS